MAATVERGARFTKERPCPVCHGHEKMPRGQGKRCTGFMGHDGAFAHCSREEHAGRLSLERNGQTYAHKLEGPCNCGETHGDAPIASPPRLTVARAPSNGSHGANGSNGGLPPAPRPGALRGEHETAAWDYETGLRVIRYDGLEEDGTPAKAYRQKHRHADGTFGWGLSPGPKCPPGCKGAARTLYQAAEVRAAPLDQWIFFVEGEKCVDALRAQGLIATTTPGGVDAFDLTKDKVAELLADRHVVVIPDEDAPNKQGVQVGARYADRVVETLIPRAASVRLLTLPGLADGEDVVEFLERGHDGEDLIKMAEARPSLVRRRVEWIPASAIFAPLPPTRWISDDLGLCPGRPAMLAGYGYSGKTIAGQALLLALASGRPIWGRFDVGAPQRVRHFDYEQGRHATSKRYQRLRLGHGIDVGEIAGRLELSVFPDAYLNSDDAIDVFAKETDGISFVLIDALRGATPGENENDSAVRSHLDMLARVSEKNGTTFALVHHAGKAKEGRRDPREILRGSSGIFDACGSVFVIAGEKTGPRLVSQAKAPAEAEGTTMPDFGLAIDDVTVGTNPKGAIRVTYTDAPEKPKKEGEAAAGASSSGKTGRPGVDFGEVRAAVMQLVRENPGELDSANAIDARCNVGSRAKRLQAFKELVKEERIVMVGGGFRIPAQVVPK